MAETNAQGLQPSADGKKVEDFNGLAGAAAAVATKGAISHIPPGRAAGLVAASIDGFVVCGIDHTEFSKSVEQAILPGTAVMPDCLPMVSLIDEAVQLVSHTFEPLSACHNELIEQAGSSSEVVTEEGDNIIGNAPIVLATELSSAERIVDDFIHQGIIICDPPPAEIDSLNHGLDSHHGGPNDLI